MIGIWLFWFICQRIAKNLNFLSEDDFGNFESEIQHIQNMIIKLQSTL